MAGRGEYEGENEGEDEEEGENEGGSEDGVIGSIGCDGFIAGLSKTMLSSSLYWD